MDGTSPAVEAALARLRVLHPKTIDLSLGRTFGLLEKLGRPQDRLPPVIHVAGTNGKGSTVAFMRAMLEAAGKRVHAYTSPHLVRFNERIRVAGSLIEDAPLIALLDEIDRVNAGDPITFFEITSAAALHAFAETPADAVLLEVGLGGRMDSTNVVDHPAAVAITRISYDHTHLLGETLRAIAFEKAGIMKPGAPVVVAEQPDGATSGVDTTFAQEAERHGAQLVAYGRDWRIGPEAEGFLYEGPGRTVRLPPPGLPGAHQRMNAATAIAALDQVPGFRLTDAQLADGLARVDWPGRLQRLARGPLVALLPAGAELWLDGGHNDSGGEVLAQHAALWADRPLGIVYGMLSTKRPAEFLAPLVPHIAALRAVLIPGEELSLPAEQSAEAAAALGVPSAPAASVGAAIADLARTLPPRARVLICGSLYLAGAVLAENG